MPELDELYQELILDHSKRPHNQREMPDADRKADGYNPLCGDRVRVFVNLQDDKVADVSFTGVGCAICTASASLMTDAVKGKARGEARALFDSFHHHLTGEGDASQLGKLAVLSGVRNYPIRVKCATLPWHTFRAALEDESSVVSTE